MTDPRFCDQCGKSLVQLPTPHTQRNCKTCKRDFFAAEPGDDGKGIKVEEGDKFIIPPGWLRMSLDPSKSSGRFARRGLPWFVQRLIMGDLPREKEGVPGLLDKWESETDDTLRSASKLEGLSIDREEDAEKILEILKKNTESIEWWAMLAGWFAHEAKERITKGGDADNMLVALRAALSWTMYVYHRDLDGYVWIGYQHTQLIYGIAVAASRTPGEADAIRALQPIFEGLSEDVLHTWVEAEVDIGPRIGVDAVDEKLLRALAKYHLAAHERGRQTQANDRDHRTRTRNLLITGAATGAAVVTAIVGALSATGVL